MAAEPSTERLAAARRYHHDMDSPGAAGAALLLCALSLPPVQAQAPSPGRQVPQRLETAVQQEVALDYLLFLPRGYEPDGGRRWPLLLFLHGAGERGSDLDRVARHGPPRIAAADPDFPFVLVSPQCPARSWWEPVEIIALLDEVLRLHRVDPARVYLTGLSMGGFGTWATGLRYPDRFAAIAPVCGGGATPDALRGLQRDRAALRSLPIRAFHGARDELVPVAESERMVAAVRRAGNDRAELTVHPEAGHDSWTATYADPKLYEWFLSHRR